MHQAEAVEACLPVVEALRALHVDHLVVGSLASSFHGVPRSTRDVDLVADLRARHAPLLAARLSDHYYVDLERVARAIALRKSFNVIYLRTMFKVDVFVLPDDPLSIEEMRRRLTIALDEETSLDVATAEDTILHKLAWYREAGEASSRQWDDLLGVLKVNRDRLDQEYLARWAPHLQVADLLARALDDAGIEAPHD